MLHVGLEFEEVVLARMLSQQIRSFWILRGVRALAEARDLFAGAADDCRLFPERRPRNG